MLVGGAGWLDLSRDKSSHVAFKPIKCRRVRFSFFVFLFLNVMPPPVARPRYSLSLMSSFDLELGGTVDLRAGNFKRLETVARFPVAASCQPNWQPVVAVFRLRWKASVSLLKTGSSTGSTFQMGSCEVWRGWLLKPLATHFAGSS